jgi:hypothetical protein
MTTTSKGGGEAGALLLSAEHRQRYVDRLAAIAGYFPFFTCVEAGAGVLCIQYPISFVGLGL